MKKILPVILIPMAFCLGRVVAEEKKPTIPLAAGKMEALELTSENDPGEMLLYRQYRPEVEPGKKYPLLIFLHGYGERGDDNVSQLKHCADDLISYIEDSKQPSFFIMPQCPDTMRWVRYRRPVNDPPHRMDRYPTLPLQLVERLIETILEEFPIDPDRVYIAGLSMGGFGTWELVSRRPELFAAALPICGGGDPDQAGRFKDLPVWAFHGGSDGVVPPAFSTRVVEALKKAGSTSVRYTEYPDVGHDSWTQTCRDREVLDWLFSQKRK